MERMEALVHFLGFYRNDQDQWTPLASRESCGAEDPRQNGDAGFTHGGKFTDDDCKDGPLDLTPAINMSLVPEFPDEDEI